MSNEKIEVYILIYVLSFHVKNITLSWLATFWAVLYTKMQISPVESIPWNFKHPSIPPAASVTCPIKLTRNTNAFPGLLNKMFTKFTHTTLQNPIEFKMYLKVNLTYDFPLLIWFILTYSTSCAPLVTPTFSASSVTFRLFQKLDERRDLIGDSPVEVWDPDCTPLLIGELRLLSGLNSLILKNNCFQSSYLEFNLINQKCFNF